MKNEAAVLRAVGEVAVESRSMPEPADGEVLVEVRSVGVCGSDVHYYQHGRIGPYVMEAPLVLGHEASGVIVATGSGVDTPRVGTRVALEPGVPCRRCDQCRRGRYNLCSRVQFFATPPVDGAFARYVSLAADFAHPIPDNLSDDAGAMIEPLAVGVAACRKARIEPGDRVLVTGAGPIGVICAQVARANGASEVIIADLNTNRLDQALTLGATRAINTREEPLSAAGDIADVLLECTGVEQVVGDGMRAVVAAGRIVLVGMGSGEEAVLPIATMQTREQVVTGVFRYANCHPAAIALAASGEVELDALVGARFGLAEAEQALRIGDTDPTVLKAVVEPGRSAAS